MEPTAKDLIDLDRNNFFHPFSNLNTHEKVGADIFVGGSKSTLIGANGKKYLDGIAGLWCVNVGYGEDRMVEAIADQAKKLVYFQALTSYGTDIAAIYSAKLLEIAPKHMSKVFFGSSGSDANDTVVKLVWYYNNLLGRPNKKKIISRKHGYHGSTIFAGGLTGFDNLHQKFDLPIARTLHASSTHPLWDKPTGSTSEEFVDFLMTELEKLILAEDPTTIAAFIAEPIMAGGGVVPPPPGYFAALQELLRKYEILFIADEVVSGFGRTGKMFGTESFSLEPDFMVLAKGITSGYVPLSAVLVGEKIWQVIAGESQKNQVFGHGYTYSGHPLAMRAALTNLEIMQDDDLLTQVNQNGEFLLSQLQEKFANHSQVGDVRGYGLLAAVEFVQSVDPLEPFPAEIGVGRRIARASLENGLIVRPLSESNTLAFSPSFVVTKDELVQMVEIFAKSAEQVLSDLT